MKHKSSKIFIYSLFSLSLLFLFARVYFELTGGFLVRNIYGPFSPSFNEEALSFFKMEIEEVKEALDQPFHYLSKGCQTYVFESSDGKYVIKFFKYQRFKHKLWSQFFSFIPVIREYLERRSLHKREKIEEFYKSYLFASKNLKDSSGLLLVHLHPSSELPEAFTIYDKIGLRHDINLNDTHFILQKKLEPLDQALLTRSDQEVKQIISSLLALLEKEAALGIVDLDDALLQNTGVLGDKALHIDVGRFCYNEKIKDKKEFIKILSTKFLEIKKLLSEKRPDLGQLIDKELMSECPENLLSNS